jgi:succinyl-CoA synthetase alpha subunit
MSTLVVVRDHTYVDSVTLLQVSAEVLGLSGVEDAALVMATDLNRDLLHEAGLLTGEATNAGSNDLVIGVRASNDTAARAALDHADALLLRRRARPGPTADAWVDVPRSIRAAHRADPDAGLAVISVPGPFAAGETRLALAEGLHVFLFSDNVPLRDEVSLKRLARQRNLLVMGPDCGTAILNGVGLGFANGVKRGSVGVVGASGTGIQEVVSLVHQSRSGISQAIGTGGRDLHAAVGGITTLQAIELLRDDPRTDTIVLVAKASDRDVTSVVLRALAATGKRTVAHLQSPFGMPAGVLCASSLEAAARLALGDDQSVDARGGARALASTRQVRGLFCGGTLCQEAAGVLGAGHALEDFGDERYTHGRAHPMIDPTLRNQAIEHAGRDPRVGVLLLDFILGLGAHADPVGAALPAIEAAVSSAHADGRELTVVAHVVGTDLDPQGLDRQEAALQAAAVHVCESNFAAATLARRIAGA